MKTTDIPPAHVPGLQNLTPAWFSIFERCGLQIVLVHLKATQEVPLWKNPEIAEALGKALEEIKAGQLDSSLYPGCLDEKHSGRALNFFHVSDRALGKAIARLKAELETLNLLGNCSILHSEQNDHFRVYWCHDARFIGKDVTPGWLPS